MIYIPYRHFEPLQSDHLLQEVISTEFYQSATLFKDDLKYIHELRLKLSHVIEKQVDLEYLPLWQEYNFQVDQLARKFPLDCIEFTWTSNHLTYQRTSKIAIRSFKFENINVLYNTMALISQIGFHQDRSDLEGLRKASLFFQNAALIADEIIISLQDVDFTIPIEYSIELFQGLKLLMLAQAQELYWQRAKSNSSDKIVAILSQQLGDFYQQSHQWFNKSQFILRAEFLNHIKCKSLHFLSAAHYRMAIHEYSASQYGLQISYLRVAQSLMKDLFKNKKNVTDLVISDLTSLRDVIESTLQTAEKENDLIYHITVPHNCPEIVGRSMVNSIPLPFNRYTHKVFENLLPFVVIQVAQAFRERQEAYVHQNLIDPINSMTLTLRNFINDRDLPMSLESITKPQRLPNSLVSMCEELYSNNAIEKIENSLSRLDQLSVQSLNLIEECDKRLDLETHENDIMRARQGTQRWNRDSSEVLQKDLRMKISQYKVYLQQARDGDETILQNYDEISPYLRMMYSLGRGNDRDLIQFLPNSNLVRLSPDLEKVVQSLTERLNQVNLEISNRSQFIETIELKSKELSILSKIISEYRLIQDKDIKIDQDLFEPIYTKHLTNFDNDTRQVYLKETEQARLESDIDQLNRNFCHLSENIKVDSIERREALKTLHDTYKGFKEIMDNIGQGLEFYSNYLSNVDKLLKECEEFLRMRRNEGEILEKDLNVQQTPTKPILDPPSSMRLRTILSDDEDIPSPRRSPLRNEYSQTPTRSPTRHEYSRSPIRHEYNQSPIRMNRSPVRNELSQSSRSSSPLKGGFWNPENGIEFD